MGNIWCTEIERGLAKLISDTIVKPINVMVRYPDTDLLSRKLPCASIFKYNQMANNIYNKSDNIILSKDIEERKAYIGNTPKRYFLSYQIDFWTKSILELNELTANWSILDNFRYLSVLDSEGSEKEVQMSLIQSNTLLEDKEERIFRAIYTYKIEAILWNNKVKIKPLVDKVIIKRGGKN